MRTCPRCQRTNPAIAVFCYFDGVNLNAPAAAEAAQADGRLPHEFVFPSGRRCKSYDDMVRACQEEWGTACELLQQGAFRQYFTGAGRLDLVKVAEDARKHADVDTALDAFLAHLPANQVSKPRLDLEPRHLRLDPIRMGEKRVVKMLVLNLGQGLLHGSISVTEGGNWLHIAGADASNTLAIKTVKEQVVRLEIDARQLMAPHKYAARLAVVTNGGIVEVAARLTVLAHPFPRAPLQGAGSPRDIAVRMRNNPKAAIPLLESGEVARWFESNKWGYPVQGRTAPGMAAVQQFFECMGLAKPPRVQLNETEARFTCIHPETVSGKVVLNSPEKKWVYGHADSDVHWLKVSNPTVSGPQQTTINYVVDSSLLDAGGVNDGVLQVIGNGGQNLSLRVRVDVRRPAEPVTYRLFRPILAGALAGFLMRLLLVVPADIYAHAGSAPGTPESIRSFALATWWIGALLGAFLLGRRGNWLDIPFGLIAGAAAGVAGSATFACVLPVLDAPALMVWHALGTEAVGAATAAWIVLAVGSWTVLGAAAAFMLAQTGRPGLRMLEVIGAPVAWLLRHCGLKRLASLFVLS